MSLRVLYDLSLAVDSVGFAGIPQETRLLFYNLAQSEKIDLAGLLRPEGRSDYRRISLKDVGGQATFIGPFLGKRLDDRSLATRAVSRFLHPRLAHAYQILVQGRNVTSDIHLADPSLADVIWRRFFVSTIPPNGRQLLAQKAYYFSKLGNDRIVASTLGFLPTQRLNTEGFKFLITQDAKPLKVSPRTVKVVRYHDGIPVTAPDTIDSDRRIRGHLASVRRCATDSIFVCNSPSALADLRSLSALAAARAVMVPDLIPEMERTSSSGQALRTIAETRMSSSTISEEKRAKALATWFGGDDSPAVPRYIMGLATIEPRKNYIRLVEAWRELRRRTGADIRLMIVGKPGWEYASTLEAMRPYVERGELLHLEGVGQTELPHLYSMALAFVFPSFAEGFGLPPTEAMQCGCPVVLSDIAAHQYMAGDAALYCDPYDVLSIATAMEFCVASREVRELLIERGYRNVRRFSQDLLRPAWEDLLHQAALSTEPGLALKAVNSAVSEAMVATPAVQRNIETMAQAARMTPVTPVAEAASPPMQLRQ
jgi:glycosyltransferase involved in cell wall biosynthesis